MPDFSNTLDQVVNPQVGWWALGLVIGVPLLMIVLTEFATHLGRRNHPLAKSLTLTRNLIIPIVAVLMLLRKVVQVPEGHAGLQIAETLAWIAGLYVALQFLNDMIFGAAGPDSWRNKVPSLFRDLTRLLLVAIGAAVIYSQVWGKSLSGAVTALGVTSIVLGLALQEPLGNIVSGLMLLFERPINLGDWVTVENPNGVRAN